MSEIRDAVRALLRSPGPALTAVLVLALGTGATTAIFSAINGVLLRPMPFADPHRLVQFGLTGVLDFQACREESRSFESMISYQAVNKSLQGVSEPERIAAVTTERGLLAVAFILLIGAGLLLRAFLRLQSTPTGVVTDRVLTLRMETRGLLPRQSTTSPSAGSATDAQSEYFRAIEQRVLLVPGVRTVGFVNLLPVQSPGNAGSFVIAGRPLPPEGSRPSVRLRYASAGYFRALGIPLRAGTLFTTRDAGVVVNETFARRFFPDEDPIGRVLDRGRIIGVVGDVRQNITLPAEPEIYIPLASSSYSAATLVVSAGMPVGGLAGPIRSAIHELNPNQAVYNITTMADVVNASHPELDLYLRSVACFAGLALVLSMAGIFGVVSHATVARQREFGIRIAVGADGGRLLRLVLAQSGVLIGTGLAIGFAGALAVTQLLRSQLYGVTPTDPATFAVAAVALACVALTACLRPAWRAMKVDPLSVLRYE